MTRYASTLTEVITWFMCGDFSIGDNKNERDRATNHCTTTHVHSQDGIFFWMQIFTITEIISLFL
jgi:hypothetical protein